MRLTREENPAEIEQYSHIKPAPVLGPLRCFAKLPGTPRTCTLAKGHDGPHVAHGLFKRVVAVWDEEEIPLASVPVLLAQLAANAVDRAGGDSEFFKALRGLPDYREKDWRAEVAAMHFAAQQVAIQSIPSLVPHLRFLAGESIMAFFSSSDSEVAERQSRLIASRGPHYVEALQRFMSAGGMGTAFRVFGLDVFESMTLFFYLSETTITYKQVLERFTYS